MDRGRAVARLASVLAEESAAPEGRVERLERQGLLHRAQVAKGPDLFLQPRPLARDGAGVLQALLEERSSGR